jgi:hypothetical protein
MELRRPVAALLTALALSVGGATLTACDAAGQNQKDGTTDNSGNSGASTTKTPTDQLPDNSNRETSTPASKSG